MIDPVSRYYVLHEQARPGYGTPPGFDSAVLRQLAAEIRREENEACAQLCDDEALEAWKAYKTGRGPGRANPRTDGMSDGAEILAGKIRARMEPKRLPTAAEVRGILKP